MKTKLSARNKKYAGGFSSGVINSEQYRNYTDSSVVAGWLGSGQRKKNRDKLLEKILRERGLGNEGVAHWLCSKLGRWLSDALDSKDNLETFEKIAREKTQDAFEEVTLWNHPDYSFENKHNLISRLFPNHEYVDGYLVPERPVVLTDEQKELSGRMRGMRKYGMSDEMIARYFDLPVRVVKVAIQYKKPKKSWQAQGPKTFHNEEAIGKSIGYV